MKTITINLNMNNEAEIITSDTISRVEFRAIVKELILRFGNQLAEKRRQEKLDKNKV